MTLTVTGEVVEMIMKDGCNVQVGPDGRGSYRWMIDGVISTEKFQNAASALADARRVVENAAKYIDVALAARDIQLARVLAQAQQEAVEGRLVHTGPPA